MTVDQTHEPALRSWVSSANGHPDFPIQNLPFGVYRRDGGSPRIGVAIGDQVLDAAAAVESVRKWAGPGESSRKRVSAACASGSLNALMALEPAERLELRRRFSGLLAADGSGRPVDPAAGPHLLAPLREVDLLVPAEIGDYTDFYASIFHASNVGALFRPDNPLLPNYKWVPIGYHGRASSIVPSGTVVRRPSGQLRPDPDGPPRFGPSRRLDYEMELGLYVGPGNPLGEPVPIGRAEGQIFGVCLVNDWSARDIQAWEYQPLGPFLAKNFATTVSPWVVTLEALAPFRAPPRPRPPGDPGPLGYLDDRGDRRSGALDITLEAWLSTAAMRTQGTQAVLLGRSRAADLYWTPAQLVAHHTSGGCNLRPGDLLASGTVSGPEPDSLGCLLELTRGGRVPLRLPSGEERTFLEDGDEIVLRGSCGRDNAAPIGLGECRGVIAG